MGRSDIIRRPLPVEMRLHFGAHVDEPGSFPDGDETMPTSQGRRYLRRTAVSAELRRFCRPMGSLARFLATSRVVFHCFGPYQE